MVKKRHNEVVVGLTFLVVLGLTMYIVIALSNPSQWFAKTKHIKIRLSYQEGLKGLTTGSPVMLGGVRIGQIVRAGIDKPVLVNTSTIVQDGKIDIKTAKPESIAKATETVRPATITNTMTVAASMTTYSPDVYFIMEIPAWIRIYDNCKLAAQSNIMGGQANLVIKDLGGPGVPYSDKSGSKNITGVGIATNRPQIPSCKLLADNADIRKNIEGGIADVIDKFKKELNPDATGTMMYKLKDTITKIQTQLSLKDQKSLMTKIHGTMDRFSHIATRIDNQLDAENSQAMMARINAALDTLNESLSRIDEMVGTNSPIITSTISSLKDTAVSLKDTAGKINKSTPEILNSLQRLLTKAEKSIDTARTALDNLKTITVDIKNMVRADRETIDNMVNNLNQVSINLKYVSREVRRAPWKLLYKPTKREMGIQGLIDSAGDFAAGAERLDNVSLRLKTVMMQAKNNTVDSKQVQNILAELKTSFQHFKEVENKFWQQLDKK